MGNKALLVIDMQPEFVSDTQMNLLSSYIRYNSSKYVKIYQTVYKRVAFNQLEEILKWSGADYHGEMISRNTYGLPELMLARIKRYNEIEIIGANLDTSILATCFQLLDAGVNFELNTEHCYCTVDKLDKTYRQSVLKVMRRCFGKSIK